MQRDKTIQLGIGVLGWPPFERQSDRYGTVTVLNPEHGTAGFVNLPQARSRGRLFAEVLEARPTQHAGDWSLNLSASPLAIGTTVALCGTGRLIVERRGSYVAVGVRPPDGRQSHWLDPRVLYGLVDQVVRLDFRHG
jgi:hypothetical protein